MKAYITSIKEKTEQVCKWQLERLGFKVILLDKKEPWINKYKRFLTEANENCVRIDADIIPNKNLKYFQQFENLDEPKMMQVMTYDLYRNDVWLTAPVFYSKKILEIARRNINEIKGGRPETQVSRMKEVYPYFTTYEKVCGLHGLYASREMIERTRKNKINRGQIKKYDFELVYKLQGLYEK